MLMLSALILWALGLLLAGLAIVRAAEPEAAASAPPPDPIIQMVDKWAHDWERGRA